MCIDDSRVNNAKKADISDFEWEQQKRSYYTSARNEVIRQWQARAADVQSQIQNFLGGRTWEQFSGSHGLSYTYVSDYGINANFLTGWWYTNVSRIALVLPSTTST